MGDSRNRVGPRGVLESDCRPLPLFGVEIKGGEGEGEYGKLASRQSVAGNSKTADEIREKGKKRMIVDRSGYKKKI